MNKIVRNIWKTVISISLITLPALLVLTLVLEIIARIFLPASDVPDVVFHPGLGNHFMENQTGTYIFGANSEITARYRINDSGWNSPYDYMDHLPGNVTRIAVIGDSYIEAMQVDYDKSYPYLLDAGLNNGRSGRFFRVHSYGHSGANFAQYIKVASYVVSTFNPDIIIINIVHNDFLESLDRYARYDNWALSPVGDSFKFRAPRPSDNLMIKRILRNSALVRYLVVNMKILERFSSLRMKMEGSRKFEANIDMGMLNHKVMREVERAVDYLCGQLRNEAGNARVLFVIDGDRQAIYKGGNPRSSSLYRLNEMLLNVTAVQGYHAIDLTDWFENDWKNNGVRFESDIDHHWNERGHLVASSAVRDFILN